MKQLVTDAASADVVLIVVSSQAPLGSDASLVVDGLEGWRRAL